MRLSTAIRLVRWSRVLDWEHLLWIESNFTTASALTDERFKKCSYLIHSKFMVPSKTNIVNGVPLAWLPLPSPVLQMMSNRLSAFAKAIKKDCPVERHGVGNFPARWDQSRKFNQYFPNRFTSAGAFSVNTRQSKSNYDEFCRNAIHIFSHQRHPQTHTPTYLTAHRR